MKELSDLINSYIEYCQYMKGLSPKSIKAYTTDLHQFLVFQDNNSNWCVKRSLEDYLKNVYQNFRPRSAKRKIACLKAFFHYLEDDELIIDNPFHKLKFKHQEPLMLPKTIPINVLSQILAHAYTDFSIPGCSEYYYKCKIRNIAVLELLFATGIRVSELCTLLPENIDLKNKFVRIMGKGSKERLIQLTNNNVLTALKKYQVYWKTEISECDCFFVNKIGNRLSAQSVRIMIDKYAKATGTTIHITPHMFRHTFATLLLEEDVDIRYIQELLGHSSITTTQIYTHISQNAQKKVLVKKHPRNRINVSFPINH